MNTIYFLKRNSAKNKFYSIISAILCMAMSSVGCIADIGDPANSKKGGSTSTPNSLAGPKTVSPTSGGESGDPFRVDNGRQELLPFAIRIQRVVDVVGAPANDAIFSLLLNNRLALGDYDYAQEVVPDLAWSTSRIVLWIKSLLPVCSSTAMKARFPQLPEGLDALMERAWGRKPEAVEVSEIKSELATKNLAADKQYETACLSVLSAAEFVVK